MGQRDFPRTRVAAATDQGDTRCRVVGGAERAPAPSARIEGLASAYRTHGGRLQRLALGHGRQNTGQAIGKHGLAGAWGPEKQEAVTTGRGDLQGALRLLLTPDLRQVRIFEPGRRRT